MKSYNAFPKPTLRNYPYTNKVRLTWNAVSASWSGSTYSPNGYYIYESPKVSWTCSNCSRTFVDQDTHPSSCPYCGYGGQDWNWSITYGTRYWTYGTTYTIGDIPLERKIAVSAYRSSPELKSEPQIIQVSNATGSYINPTGSVSLINANRYIYGNSDTSDPDHLSAAPLSASVYGGDLNLFSKVLPGTNQVHSELPISQSWQVRDYITNESVGSWKISSSAAPASRSAALTSFRNYTDAYEVGVSGSTFLFPWGNFKFWSNLDPHEGIVDTNCIEDELTFSLYRGRVGLYKNADVNQRGQNIDQTFYIGGSAMSDLTNKNWAYVGLILYNPNLSTVAYWRDDSSIYQYYIPTSGSAPIANVTLADAVQSSSIFTIESGSRLYPAIFYNPSMSPDWHYYSRGSTQTIASYIITVGDIYLPISVNY